MYMYVYADVLARCQELNPLKNSMPGDQGLPRLRCRILRRLPCWKVTTQPAQLVEMLVVPLDDLGWLLMIGMILDYHPT